MQIKAVDDKQREIDELTALVRRPDVDSPTREDIETEIRNVRAGVKAEREAAYQIEFHLAANNNLMTIHGLRIVCEGRVAQIDHLIMNRGLQFWVCESKYVGERVDINDRGEWTTYYRGEPRGMQSPIEQVKRQVSVLKDVFSTGLLVLPQRFGVQLKPQLKTLIVVSKRARISRPPAGQVDGVDTVIKSDQLVSTIDNAFEQGGVESLIALAKVVSRDTLESLARQLVALHAPMKNNWPAKFRLSPEPPATLLDERFGDPIVAPAAKPTNVVAIDSAPQLVCAACGMAISAAVELLPRELISVRWSAVLCFMPKARHQSVNIRSVGRRGRLATSKGRPCSIRCPH